MHHESRKSLRDTLAGIICNSAPLIISCADSVAPPSVYFEYEIGECVKNTYSLGDSEMFWTSFVHTNPEKKTIEQTQWIVQLPFSKTMQSNNKFS